MNKITVILIITFLMGTACKPGKTKTAESKDTENKVVMENPTTTELGKKDFDCADAKAWLVKMIPDFFNGNDGDLGVMRVITTPQYYAYKLDAMNVGMDTDGSLSESDFVNKWKDKYDVSKAGVNLGFLITGQDWDMITVESCEFIASKNDTCTFNLVLADAKMNARYQSIVKVVDWGELFVIGDVLQED